VASCAFSVNLSAQSLVTRGTQSQVPASASMMHWQVQPAVPSTACQVDTAQTNAGPTSGNSALLCLPPLLQQAGHFHLITKCTEPVHALLLRLLCLLLALLLPLLLPLPL
jgi:hypothetical protein